MSDIFREVDEEVQREKVETLWSRYQTPVFVIAGLIVAATGAWNYYVSEKTKAAEAANTRFMAAVALADSGKSAEAITAFEALAKDAPKGYATLARLRGAEELGKTDKAKAIEMLDAIADDKGVDRLTQEVALLRSAVYTMDAGDSEKSMLKLGPLMTAKGVFRFSAQEWTGLDALQNQDYDEAERVFSLLMNDRDAPQAMRQRASAYTGLLHAARGAKPVGAITSVTPIIEPADGSSAADAPTVTIEKK
ncbi:MAG: tetratricopeptide repeat protein [Methylocystis sp.]